MRTQATSVCEYLVKTEMALTHFVRVILLRLAMFPKHTVADAYVFILLSTLRVSALLLSIKTDKSRAKGIFRES